MICSRDATRSLRKSATGSCRRSNMHASITMLITVLWSLPSGIGSGFVCSTARPSPCFRPPARSLAPNTPALFRCWNVSGQWPIVYNCRRTPGSTTSSTSASSSPSSALPRQLLRHYLHSNMDALCSSPSASSVPAYDVEPDTSWCSGLACLQQRQHGSRSTHSALPTPCFNSRMSCSRRGGEMLWWENSTTVGIAPVARADHQGSWPNGTAPRAWSPRLLELGQSVQLVDQVDLLCFR